MPALLTISYITKERLVEQNTPHSQPDCLSDLVAQRSSVFLMRLCYLNVQKVAKTICKFLQVFASFETQNASLQEIMQEFTIKRLKKCKFFMQICNFFSCK